MKFWTLSFLRDWTPRMSLRSALRLRGCILRQQQGKMRPNGVVRLRVKQPFHGDIVLREYGSDLATFNEIVVKETYAQVLPMVGALTTIIDLGANIGLASLYLGSRSPTCKILAVEPNPENQQLLSRNLENLAGRSEILGAAVWSRQGRLSPDDSVPRERFSSTRLCELHNAESRWTVEALTMPQIIARSGFSEVDLLKVDIEGAEAELFSGEDLSWLKKVGSIAIEFHQDSRRASRFDEIMKCHGFKICSEGAHTVIARKLDYRGGRAAES